MEEWLINALAEKRKQRALTDTARRVGIEPTRLSRIANQYVAPTIHEVEALKALLMPADASQPAAAPAAASAPQSAVATPSAASAATASAVTPATPAAPVSAAAAPAAATPSAAKPAPVQPKPAAAPASAPAPRPAVATNRLSPGLAAMKIPLQVNQSDFVYRQELLKFIFSVRDWPTQHAHPLPGDFAYLQTLWNEAQKAIDVVNRRLYGDAAPPIPQNVKSKPARRHHSSRFLFMQVAEERLPVEVVTNIRESAHEGLKGGAAQGFLEAFQLAAEAILDEEDYKTLCEESKQRAKLHTS